jgi:hypothetical protein
MSSKFTPQEVQQIDALRIEKGWSFQALVARLQKIAADENALYSKPGKPTGDYIGRVLRGKRPASEHWRLLIARAFNLNLDDFKKRCEVGIPRNNGKVHNSQLNAVVLPINYWPHLRWRSSESPERKIAVRLYGLSRSGLRTTLTTKARAWKYPGNFDGYEQLRQTAWHLFTANFQRMKKEPPNPEPLWHVDSVNMLDDSSVALELSLSDSRDVVITNSFQGLSHQIRLSDSRETSVQQWLAENWTPGDASQPVIPCARQLVTNILVLTKDNEVVMGLQGADNPDSSNCWTTGVSRLVYPKTDTDSDGQLDLEKSASSGCIRELGISLRGRKVKWVTLAAGLKFGSFTFFGVVETDYNRDQIRKMFEKNRQSHLRSGLAHEVVDIEFVKIDPRIVAERLALENYRPYYELGLALLLWLQGKAELLVD